MGSRLTVHRVSKPCRTYSRFAFSNKLPETSVFAGRGVSFCCWYVLCLRLTALGVYPPRVKCFELKELSMKFERRLDAPAIQFLPLTEDYTKMVFLRTDRYKKSRANTKRFLSVEKSREILWRGFDLFCRYLEFHAQFGTYFKIRVPKVHPTFCTHFLLLVRPRYYVRLCVM